MRTGTGNNLKAALKPAWARSWRKAICSPKRIAAVFAAHRAGKDIDEPLAKLRAAQQLLRPAAWVPTAR